MDRIDKKIALLGLSVVCFGFAAWATVWGLVIWVAWHFISKYW